VEERARQRDLLAHPLAEVDDERAAVAFESEHFEQLAAALLDHVARHRSQQSVVAEQLLGGETIEQAKVLG
jgi:hypothetical protein